jgi:hypothetical protein
MESLIAEIIDYIFGFFGKIIWRLVRYPFGSNAELSRGAYQAIGLIVFIVIFIGGFLILGYLNERTI